jgi:hypothetical protein
VRRRRYFSQPVANVGYLSTPSYCRLDVPGERHRLRYRERSMVQPQECRSDDVRHALVVVDEGMRLSDANREQRACSFSRPPPRCGAGVSPSAQIVASCRARTSATTGHQKSAAKILQGLAAVGELSLEHRAQRRSGSRSGRRPEAAQHRRGRLHVQRGATKSPRSAARPKSGRLGIRHPVQAPRRSNLLRLELIPDPANHDK